jgi:hypothetical protein
MPTENKPAVPGFDLNTPDGGRGYIAHLFKTVLRRHDYRQYIAERLAGDFACTLAQHFEDIKARERDLQLRLNAADQRIDELTVPTGYCLMPTRLTAENGAKALLLGEFKLEVTTECPECRDLEEPSEGCEICDGEGEYGQQHMIPWDQIKFIYSEAVKGLAKNPNTPQ